MGIVGHFKWREEDTETLMTQGTCLRQCMGATTRDPTRLTTCWETTITCWGLSHIREVCGIGTTPGTCSALFMGRSSVAKPSSPHSAPTSLKMTKSIDFKPYQTQIDSINMTHSDFTSL